MAAETDDFFRSRPFYDAEGVTHTLRIEGAGFGDRMPAAGPRDRRHRAVRWSSPYGFPGAAVREQRGTAPDPAEIDGRAPGWSACSPASGWGEPCLATPTERSAVQVHDPSRPRGLRSRFVEQIRRNSKRGYRVSCCPGRESSVEQRASFHAVYTQTMRRAEAAERYLFEPGYFATILGFDRSWLLLCHSHDGGHRGGAIAALSDGLLHYYLGGTAEAHLGDSPFKNVVEAMIELAAELGVLFNLGGGFGPGTAWRTSSAASPTASSRSTHTRSSAIPRPTGA